MNYYEHHLGDYAKDTGHLSMLEHGAYRLLLDRYYSTEEGIPAAQAYRLARARSDEERQAVDAVLEEFFTLIDGTWVNRRAEEEITSARGRISAAQQNGKKGGRPRKSAPFAHENETQQKPSGFSAGYENETQQKAHQTPDTNHQTPVVLNDDSSDVTTVGKTNPPPPSSSVDPIQSRAIELTVLLRPRGAALQAADPHVQQWATTGITDAQALTALETAKQQRADKCDISPINSGYINAILQSQTNPQAKARASPVSKINQIPDHSNTKSGRL